MGLIGLLPPFYKGNQTMEELQNILTLKINDLVSAHNETINECFVNTSTKLLSRYERIYGIDIDINKDVLSRRERIKARIMGTGLVTKELIKDIAESYSGGAVEVIEDYSIYRFIVKFVGTLGEPNHVNEMMITMNEIKPAHLVCEFEYAYNTYGDLEVFQHSDFQKYYTYWQLRNQRLTKAYKNLEFPYVPDKKKCWFYAECQKIWGAPMFVYFVETDFPVEFKVYYDEHYEKVCAEVTLNRAQYNAGQHIKINYRDYWYETGAWNYTYEDDYVIELWNYPTTGFVAYSNYDVMFSEDSDEQYQGIMHKANDPAQEGV